MVKVYAVYTWESTFRIFDKYYLIKEYAQERVKLLNNLKTISDFDYNTLRFNKYWDSLDLSNGVPKDAGFYKWEIKEIKVEW